MKVDYKKLGMCRVDMSVLVMVTYLLSDSTMVKNRQTTQKCGFFNLNTPGSAMGIQIKESTFSHRFSIT